MHFLPFSGRKFHFLFRSWFMDSGNDRNSFRLDFPVPAGSPERPFGPGSIPCAGGDPHVRRMLADVPRPRCGRVQVRHVPGAGAGASRQPRDGRAGATAAQATPEQRHAARLVATSPTCWTRSTPWGPLLGYLHSVEKNVLYGVFIILSKTKKTFFQSFFRPSATTPVVVPRGI